MMRLTARQTETRSRLQGRETGLCAGTLVMTLDGDKPVEALRAGDRVVTRDRGVAVLRAVDQRELDVRPIVIKGGSLGHTRPEMDMTVTPGTRIHVRDWRAKVLFGMPSADIEAHRLADGEFVARQKRQQMQVFDLQFDADHIIYANGVEVALRAA